MAGLFDKQAEIYLKARPTYPTGWYEMLASRTHQHAVAWDVGTGNGQAAIRIASSIKQVAKHYHQVIATDISEPQLMYTIPHPCVRYVHTPATMTEDEMLELLGGENSVDLITVATAVHWFDLPKFYSLAKRVLRSPGGVIAIWGYNHMEVNPEFEEVEKRIREASLEFWHPNTRHIMEGYRTIPFPFESVGLGKEGEPLQLSIQQEVSFQGVLKVAQSASALTIAKENGVDVLLEDIIEDLEVAWGGRDLVRIVTYKAFMLAGTIA